jgi:hypothetical protein
LNENADHGLVGSADLVKAREDGAGTIIRELVGECNKAKFFFLNMQV